MGIWMYFYDNTKWHNIYVKNCSLKSPTDWYEAGHANVALGVTYSTIGIIFELIYIPFMIAMLQPEFIKHSCYKFMFLIGIIDLIVVPCNAIITGIQCILGAHYCLYPTFFFFVGAIGTCGFYGTTFSCVLLGIDRFLEMCFPKIAKQVFGGKRIFIWLTIPVVYTVYSGFHVPFLYNTKRYAYYTDPFVEIEGMSGNEAFVKFKLAFHIVNNLFCCTSLVLLYSSLVIIIKIKSIFHNNVHISKMQKLLTYQAICICLEIWMASITYIINQIWEIPNIIEVIAQISWIGIHGDTPIVYLILNASLRKAVFLMLKNTTKQGARSTIYLVKSSFMPSRSTVAPGIPAIAFEETRQ